MNHSYHEMIVGYGRGFSSLVLSETQESIKRLQYAADDHRLQWLAAQTLENKGRAVVSTTIRDTDEASRRKLKEFFCEVASRLPRRR